MVKPPHVDRLVQRILESDVAWVQLWGPPGQGKRAILRELQKRGATPLAQLELNRIDRLALGSIEGQRVGLIEGQPSPELLAKIREGAPALSLFVIVLPQPLPTLPYAGVQLGPLDLAVTLDEAREWNPKSVLHWKTTQGWWRPMHLLVSGEHETVKLFLQTGLGPIYRGVLENLQSSLATGKLPSQFEVEKWRTLGWWGGDSKDEGPLPLLVRDVEREGKTHPWNKKENPVFQISFFGQSLLRRLDDGKVKPLRWNLRRSLAIVAYLALKGPASRDELMEMAWPGGDHQEYRFRFHTTLSNLRRELTQGLRLDSSQKPVITRDGWYQLNEEFSWVIDCREFEREIERGERYLRDGEADPALQAFLRAIKAYAEPLLPEITESWIEKYREQYRELQSLALNHSADLAQRLGQSLKAQGLYRRILQQEPWREDAHLALMRLYAGEGRRGDVHRQYVDLCDFLSRETGQSPTEEVSEEYHRLMR